MAYRKPKEPQKALQFGGKAHVHGVRPQHGQGSRIFDKSILPEESNFSLPQLQDSITNLAAVEENREAVAENLWPGTDAHARRLREQFQNRYPTARFSRYLDALGRGVGDQKLEQILEQLVLQPLRTEISSIEADHLAQRLTDQRLSNDLYAQEVFNPSRSQHVLKSLREVLEIEIKDLIRLRDQVSSGIEAVDGAYRRCQKLLEQAQVVVRQGLLADQQLTDLVRRTDSELQSSDSRFGKLSDRNVRHEAICKLVNGLRASSERLEELQGLFNGSLKELGESRQRLAECYTGAPEKKRIGWQRQSLHVEAYLTLFELLDIDLWRFVGSSPAACADPANCEAWDRAMSAAIDSFPDGPSNRIIPIAESLIARLVAYHTAREEESLGPKSEVPTPKVDPLILAVATFTALGLTPRESGYSIDEAWEALVGSGLTCGIDRREFSEAFSRQLGQGGYFLLKGIGRFSVSKQGVATLTAKGWHKALPDDFANRLRTPVTTRPAPPSEATPTPILPRSTSERRVSSPAVDPNQKSSGHLTVAEFALCVMACVCSRRGSYSRRTWYRFYHQILKADPEKGRSDLTFGFSKEEFRDGVMAGWEEGWLDGYPKGKKARPEDLKGLGVDPHRVQFRPSPMGFKMADRLKIQLPADLPAKLLAAHEALQVADLERRDEFQEKRRQQQD